MPASTPPAGGRSASTAGSRATATGPTDVSRATAPNRRAVSRYPVVLSGGPGWTADPAPIIEGVIADQLVIDARYAAYVDRQSEDVAMLRRDEAVRIPQDFVYANLPGLSVELQHKLERHRPATLAAAGQIDGITPSALMLVLAHVKKAQPRRVAG